MTNDRAEALFAEYLQALGLSPDADPELAGTPERFTALLRERFQTGRQLPPLEPLATQAENDDLVIIKGLHFHSLCVHHITPFFGTVAVAFIPDQKLVGFGAVHRLLSAAAAQPQLQERLTSTLADRIEADLAPRGLVVASRARQMCMELTGTPAGAETFSVAARGQLAGDEGRALGLKLLE